MNSIHQIEFIKQCLFIFFLFVSSYVYTQYVFQMVEHIDILFPALQRTLSDESDQVVQQCLVVIAEVISSPKTTNAAVESNKY